MTLVLGFDGVLVYLQKTQSKAFKNEMIPQYNLHLRPGLVNFLNLAKLSYELILYSDI